jgi:hypothetical protein
MEVEAAKGVLYCRPMLGAVKLYVRCTSATEEEDYNLMYFIDSVH